MLELWLRPCVKAELRKGSFDHTREPGWQLGVAPTIAWPDTALNKRTGTEFESKGKRWLGTRGLRPPGCKALDLCTKSGGVERCGG